MDVQLVERKENKMLAGGEDIISKCTLLQAHSKVIRK